MKINIRDNKGINLISLTVTVIILLIITGAMIFNTKNQISMRQIDGLKTDIELLNSKVDEYYLKYGELPILCDYTSNKLANFKSKDNFYDMIVQKAHGRGCTLGAELNQNDGNNYAVIDLERLGGITLTYGYEDEYTTIKNAKQINTQGYIEDTIYVINTKSHQIYFPHGIFVDNVMYYTFL